VSPIPLRCDSHDACEAQFASLSDRIDRVEQSQREHQRDVWAAVNALRDSMAELKAGLAEMKGSVRGYVLTGTVLAGVIGFIAARVF
jgi:hypothetical protein